MVRLCQGGRCAVKAEAASKSRKSHIDYRQNVSYARRHDFLRIDLTEANKGNKERAPSSRSVVEECAIKSVVVYSGFADGGAEW